ncbi:rod shape-determining protein MreC [Persephonella sp.]
MKKKLIAAGVAVVLLAVGGTAVIKLPLLKSIALDASQPFLTAVNFVSDTFSRVLYYFSSKNQLIEENKKLQQKVELLKAQVVYLKSVEKENAHLREIVNFISRIPQFQFKTGKIIGYSPDNWSSYVVINLGSADGIKRGDVVIANGYLFGEVYQVGLYSSSVVLTSDKNFKISARCRKTGEAVFFQGKNTQEGVLLYVKPHQDIRIGDIVETDSLNRKIPSGIPIGTVKTVSYVEGNFYKDVSVSLPLNPWEIEYVVVVLGEKTDGKKEQ